jgi:type II restriction enzyme
MNLSMTGALADAYKSGSQSARVVTETWGAENFYCPNCPSPSLKWLRAGTKAIDYRCPDCEFEYQLKSQRASIRNSVPDGDYKTMMDAVKNDATPNFYFMQYEFATWTVRNLLLVPHFAFPPSAIVKRNPTTPKDRRNPWIGCNIALSRIPIDARISLVVEKQIVPAMEVRKQFRRVKPLEQIPVAIRGWTLDVLNIARNLGKQEFTNDDIYAFERELKIVYPGNNTIRDQIRKQLQNLRDAELLLHVGSGRWRLP